MFSSIFPKLGSSFFDLNMSLGKAKTVIKVDPTASPLGLSEIDLSHFPFKQNTLSEGRDAA